MDIKGLRTLNLIGTILFFLIGILLASVNYIRLTWIPSDFRDTDYSICMGTIVIWFCIIITFSILLFRYTVIGLDLGEYETAKTWTLIGCIVGFAGGIIPLIIFIISYASFDDAIQTQQWRQTHYNIYQQPSPNRYCIGCRRQIPFDSKLCPYCGVQQSLTPPPKENNKNTKEKGNLHINVPSTKEEK